MNVTLSERVSGYYSRPVFDDLEATMAQLNADAPAGLLGFHAEHRGKWMRMRTEEVTMTTAFGGAGISLVFAGFVLLVATKNAILAAVAFFSIGGILVSCIGFMAM